MKYRKKPVVIDAIQYWPAKESDIKNWLDELDPTIIGKATDIIFDMPPGTLTIQTLEGNMIANPGDYIIRGVQGEFYPCKPDIFEATYEKVE